jgi:hypothetical protein
VSAVEALAQAILDDRVRLEVVHQHAVGTHVSSTIYIEVDQPEEDQ